MTKLQDVLAKKQVWRDALNALRPGDVSEAFDHYFSSHPEVEALRWHQGMRGLDDGGDPCYFDVDDVEVKLFASEQFAYEWDLEEVSEEAEYAVRDVDFDVLEVVFGEYANVVVTRTGFEVKESDE